jgi:hypothetical protein
MIQASEKALSFNGDSDTALRLIDSLRDAYDDKEMPKMLNDFVFNLEVALQNAGVLNEWFEEMK